MPRDPDAITRNARGQWPMSSYRWDPATVRAVQALTRRLRDHLALPTLSEAAAVAWAVTHTLRELDRPAPPPPATPTRSRKRRT